MTETSSSFSRPEVLEHATVAELEELLADAEADIKLLREELAERRRQAVHEQSDELLDEGMQPLKGSWRNLFGLLRSMIAEEREYQAHRRHTQAQPAGDEESPQR